MKVSNLDTIEFIFNFIYSVFIYFVYSVAWLFLGYGMIQVVQKMLLKRRWPNKNFITLFTSNQNLDLIWPNGSRVV